MTHSGQPIRINELMLERINQIHASISSIKMLAVEEAAGPSVVLDHAISQT
jgi:hypothetical protein